MPIPPRSRRQSQLLNSQQIGNEIIPPYIWLRCPPFQGGIALQVKTSFSVEYMYRQELRAFIHFLLVDESLVLLCLAQGIPGLAQGILLLQVLTDKVLSLIVTLVDTNVLFECDDVVRLQGLTDTIICFGKRDCTACCQQSLCQGDELAAGISSDSTRPALPSSRLPPPSMNDAFKSEEKPEQLNEVLDNVGRAK